MKIQIISKKIDQKVLLELTNAWFKSFVKFVVDIKTGKLAVGGELHSDAELLLLENDDIREKVTTLVETLLMSPDDNLA